MTFAAVVPVAVFSRENWDMTTRFLDALLDEPGLHRLVVYFNGGMARTALKLRSENRFELVDARGWPFYRMWNEGLALTVNAPATLVLNNDIEWPRGALQAMAHGLLSRPDDVVCVVPNLESDAAQLGDVGWFGPPPAKGHLGLTCCWASRQLARRVPPIDERYTSWYGDNELARNIEQAGLRVELMPGVPVQHLGERTMRLVPGVQRARRKDRRLYESKWGGT